MLSADAAEGMASRLDILLVKEGTEAKPCRPAEAVGGEVLVGKGGAVQSGAAQDAVIVLQQISKALGMIKAVDGHREDPAAIVDCLWAEQAQAGHPVGVQQGIEHDGHQGLLMPVEILDRLIKRECT